MTSNVIDQPAKADEDRLNMKAYADALTEFSTITMVVIVCGAKNRITIDQV